MPGPRLLVSTTPRTASNPRLLAARLVDRVLHQGDSLSTALVSQLASLDDPRERALAQELSFGTLRWFYRLDGVLRQLLPRPLKTKDRDLYALLLVGLYQLLLLEMPAHAAVSETVEAVRGFGKGWAAGLVNGVLRNALRRKQSLLAAADGDPQSRWSHPQWWITRVQQDWPEQWQEILHANNQRPPMVLRVNRRQGDRASYLAKLEAAGIGARALRFPEMAIVLDKPVAVDSLPDFRSGAVSVQDAAAQLSAPLLMLQDGQRVLDACAAPGGKTGHILESVAGLAEVVAIDKDAVRLDKIADNLRRLQLGATCRAADAGDPASWWDGRPFDRILLDAPCSASGVVRRHPDIKILRRADDLPALSEQQSRLLEALWPLLVSGGILLYVTCSVFRRENNDVVQAFLGRHSDARELPLDAEWGLRQAVGRQLLPGEHGMDGFYFARLVKA
jgi:16S rRNA (cytosine967-C5)-methyltransferase